MLGFKASLAFILQLGRVHIELACEKNGSDCKLLSSVDCDFLNLMGHWKGKILDRDQWK